MESSHCHQCAGLAASPEVLISDPQLLQDCQDSRCVDFKGMYDCRGLPVVAHSHWLALLSLTGVFVQSRPHLLATHVCDAYSVITVVPLLHRNAYFSFATSKLRSKVLQENGSMC